MQAQQIKQIILNAMPNAIVDITGDDGRHFSATIIAEEFLGKTRVQQQQLVYAALGTHITNGDIHALSLKTFTPAAWSALNK